MNSMSSLRMVLGLFLLLPQIASAQAIITNLPDCNFSTGRVHFNCIPAFLSHIIQFIFGLTGAVFLIMVIIAGYQIAIGKAIGKDRSEGLTRLRVAIVGFILCAISWYIVDFIISALAGI